MITIVLYGCSGFSKPKLQDSKRIKTELGDIFFVERVEYNFPDQEIEINISQNNKNIYRYDAFAGNLNSYNYDNDLKNNYYVIINEYEKGSTKAYQFYWGIIYTLDNGNSYFGVPKHEYNVQYDINGNFKTIYNSLK